MKDLTTLILESFNDITSDVKCNSDFYNLPTYWHVDNKSYLIRENKETITIECHSKRIFINKKDTKKEIINKIYKNLIY